MATEFSTWWHGVPALPLSRTSASYKALRRIWADQTINSRTGARGFYRWDTEDYLTPVLWQTWAILPDFCALADLLRSVGVPVGHISEAKWAYACEEETGHGRAFVIPDIMLHYRDERGDGLVAIEAKRPGVGAKSADLAKLQQYVSLPSTRAIARRHGVFLVSRSAERASTQAGDQRFPVLTWEAVLGAQALAAKKIFGSPSATRLVEDWIRSLASRHGLGPRHQALQPLHTQYASAQGHEIAAGLDLSDAARAFIMGSECVEAARAGNTPAPPFPWLAQEPAAVTCSTPGFQSTADRRQCLWKLR